jgi:hypothetical protein
MATQKQKGYKQDILNAEAPELGKLPLALEPKSFNSGKVGFYCGGPIALKVNGRVVKFQCSISLAAHHSDQWPDSRPAPAADKPQKSNS